jgi:hypothetical protein
MKIINSKSFRNANFEIKAYAFQPSNRSPFEPFRANRSAFCSPFEPFRANHSEFRSPFQLFRANRSAFHSPFQSFCATVQCSVHRSNRSVQTVQRSTGVVVHSRVCTLQGTQNKTIHKQNTVNPLLSVCIFFAILL